MIDKACKEIVRHQLDDTFYVIDLANVLRMYKVMACVRTRACSPARAAVPPWRARGGGRQADRTYPTTTQPSPASGARLELAPRRLLLLSPGALAGRERGGLVGGLGGQSPPHSNARTTINTPRHTRAGPSCCVRPTPPHPLSSTLHPTARGGARRCGTAGAARVVVLVCERQVVSLHRPPPSPACCTPALPHSAHSAPGPAPSRQLPPGYRPPRLASPYPPAQRRPSLVSRALTTILQVSPGSAPRHEHAPVLGTRAPSGARPNSLRAPAANRAGRGAAPPAPPRSDSSPSHTSPAPRAPCCAARLPQPNATHRAHTAFRTAALATPLQKHALAPPHASPHDGNGASPLLLAATTNSTPTRRRTARGAVDPR